MLQTSQFLFFNGNVVFDWLCCGNDRDSKEGGRRGREEGVGEDCLNIVIKVTSTQDRVITQPCTQGVKSVLDDNPGLGLGEVTAVRVGPCSCC